MAFLERLGARVVVRTGEKLIRRMARDIKMKRIGYKQGYKDSKEGKRSRY